jgi:hypothetical protein
VSTPLCFVDTETTDIGHRRLAWELAIIRRDPGGTRREIQTFIEIDLTDANPFALKVGGFYDRHPLGRWLAGPTDMHPENALSDYRTRARSPRGFTQLGSTSALDGYLTQEEAAALWCRWTHGAHVVGAVPNFDTEVTAAAARSVGLLSAHHYHLIDIETLIVGWLRGRLQFDTSLDAGERLRMERLSAPPWKSDELFAEIGVSVPEGDRHTALGDARACERAWDALYGTQA